MKSTFSKICLQASLAVLFAGEALAEMLPEDVQLHIDPLDFEHAFEIHLDHYGAEILLDGTAEVAEKSGGFPQLDPTWYASQMFWLALSFGFLYIFFSKKVIPALSGTIESRRERIQEDLEKAAKMKDEAERVHFAYEEALSDARAQASDMFTQTEARMKAKSEKKLNSLNDKAVKQTQDAEAAVEQAKREALKDINTVAAEIASLAAEKIVGVTTDAKQALSVVDSINKKAA